MLSEVTLYHVIRSNNLLVFEEYSFSSSHTRCDIYYIIYVRRCSYCARVLTCKTSTSFDSRTDDLTWGLLNSVYPGTNLYSSPQFGLFDRNACNLKCNHRQQRVAVASPTGTYFRVLYRKRVTYILHFLTYYRSFSGKQPNHHFFPCAAVAATTSYLGGKKISEKLEKSRKTYPTPQQPPQSLAQARALLPGRRPLQCERLRPGIIVEHFRLDTQR